MNARHILLCLALSLLGAGLQAQTDLPQVFSPNAAELGKYGKIPVSYFNGLPNITIPLTELRAKNYTLPIYLTYHAGGNKPDQHPGWVGLGWTLHVGGCINRIVNDKIDELCQEEQASLNSTEEYGTITSIEDPGFLFHGHLVQGDTIIRHNDELQKERMSRAEYTLLDKEPDEFQVCVDGIGASFFVTGDGNIRIKSKGAVDFTARIILSDNDNNLLEMYPSTNVNAGSTYWTRVFRYIREIELVSAKGIKYVFGGDWNSIEVSSSHLSGPAYDNDGSPVWQAPVGHVNTWHLREMVFPDGETISFEYEQAGIPIVKSGCYNSWSFTYAGETYSGLHSLDEKSYDTYTFLFPCYLKRVTGSMNGESLLFHSGETTELEYDINEQGMSLKTGAFTEYHPFSQFTDKNYYKQLNAIEGNQGGVLFHYSHSHGQRLRLEAIMLADRDTTISRERYEFCYNEDGYLPKYNSRKTDMWGYYRGAAYSMFLPQRMNQSRTPSPDSTKVGVLEKIIYPTGGYTAFEYEQNDYSGYIGDDPTQIVISSGIGGGLRIKRIIDNDGANTSIRSFLYRRDSGESSGTLSGIPRFYYVGSFVRNEIRWNDYQSGVQQPFWYNAFNLDDDEDGLEDFEIGSEQFINELSLTDGSHVTYDQVEEVFDDGSKVVRKYQSYAQYPDDAPRILFGNFDGPGLKYRTGSRELSRGLLSEEKNIDSSGRTVRIVHNEYNDIQDGSPLSAIAFVKYGTGYYVHRHYYYPVYSYYPYLRERTEIQYSDDGCDSLIVTTDYTYDSHRNLTSETRTSGDQTVRDDYTYPGNYPDIPFYADMSTSGRHALPVEHVRSVDGAVSEAELVTWKQAGAPGDYVPSERFKATPTGLPDFTVLYDGITVNDAYGPPLVRYLDYDAHSNLTQSATPDGTHTSYTWDRDSTHLRGIFVGAERKERSRIWSEQARVTEEEDLSDLHDRFYGNSFTTVADGPVTVNIWFDAGDERDIWGRFDGDSLLSFHCPVPTSTGGLTPIYTCTFQLPAGQHFLSLSTREGVFLPVIPVLHSPGATGVLGDHPGHDPLDPVVIIDPNGKLLRGYLSLTYWGDADYVHVRDEAECAHFSFEDTGDTADGFQSTKSQTAETTVHLVLNPDRTYTMDRRVMRNGKWVYERMPFGVNTTDTYTLHACGAPFDEVRIYADGVQPETCTWWPDGNLRSRTDARGVTESYVYDGLGRLTGVYDNEGNKVEGYQYNYKNR